MYDPEKYAAVADNFVYVHRALRRDLARIIEGGRELFESDFPRFARILAKHTELEQMLQVSRIMVFRAPPWGKPCKTPVEIFTG